MFKILATAVAFSLAALGAANAATVTSDNPTVAELTALSATSVVLPGGAAFTSLPGSPATVVGSLDLQYRSPFEQLGAAAAEIPYFSVSAGKTATLDIKSVRTAFSFLWGSVDGFNTLRLVNTLTSESLDVVLADLGNPEDPVIGRRASFVTVSGFSFNQVQFLSDKNAFEFSNIAAVPLPAGGLLLIGAVGGLVALRRRKALAA